MVVGLRSRAILEHSSMVKRSLKCKKCLWLSALIVTTVATLAIQSVARAAEPVGNYADVNGLHMYYEVHGKGALIC